MFVFKLKKCANLNKSSECLKFGVSKVPTPVSLRYALLVRERFSGLRTPVFRLFLVFSFKESSAVEQGDFIPIFVGDVDNVCSQSFA